MSPNVTDLSPEQNQAIDLYASGKTTGDISEALGVHRRTLWRWRQLSAFQQVLRDLQRRRHEEIHELTADVLGLALSALKLEMEALQKSSWHRLENASTVLRLLKDIPLITPAEPLIIPNDD